MSDKAWYVIHTRTGFEERVLKILQSKIDSGEVAGRIFQVLIPTEDVMQVKNNQKKVSKRKFFPGYVLAEVKVEAARAGVESQVEMENTTYWTIRGVQGVSGFLGDPKPVPMGQEEVQQILELMNSTSAEKPKPAVQFEKGENVRIIEGPFKHFMGMVEDVNEAKAKLRVTVTVFDRPTPVELDFLQVEKV
jgi:transcriptional antiterminator NusG